MENWAIIIGMFALVEGAACSGPEPILPKPCNHGACATNMGVKGSLDDSLRLTAEPSRIDFGSVVVGSDQVHNLHLQTSGSTRALAISIEPSSSTAFSFEIENSSSSTAAVALVIHYHPLEVAAHHANLVVSVPTTDTVLKVPLDGNSTVAAQRPTPADARNPATDQPLIIELDYGDLSDNLLTRDLRTADLSLESPLGLTCNQDTPNPMTWGGYGHPIWNALGPQGNSRRILLPDAAEDGHYRVLVTGIEDCKAAPQTLISSALGLSIDELLQYLSGEQDPKETQLISQAIDKLCLAHDGLSVHVTILANGQNVFERSVMIARKGDTVDVADIEHVNGQVVVR